MVREEKEGYAREEEMFGKMGEREKRDFMRRVMMEESSDGEGYGLGWESEDE